MENIQNRTDLYDGSNQVMVAEGVYPAELVQVRHLIGPFGRRVGLLFRICDGEYKNVEILDTAFPKTSPKGKLAEMLGGLCKEIPADLNELVGKRCRIAVQHETSGRGKRYVGIARTYQ
jgi:hypothetical protein